MIKPTSGHLFCITYLLICFIISIPFNNLIYQLLFTSDGIPAGGDNPFHTYAILRILDTNNPLIPYTQFPAINQNGSVYYPSFLHLTLATIIKIAGLDQASIANPTLVIEIEKLFMFTVSIVGSAGYALLIRTLLYRLIAAKVTTNSSLFLDSSRYRLLNLIVSILAFSFFIYSVAPIIQTFNDGSYAQVFAMWSIFPYYLHLLVNKRWILSGFLLSIIASIHNLALLMSLSATVPYLISLLFQKHKDLKKNIAKFFLIFIISAIPAFLFFYIPSMASLLSSSTSDDNPSGLVGNWPVSNVIYQLKPGLFYAGIACVALLLIFNFRSSWWIFGWVSIYLITFDLSSIIGGRFARELSVVFGIVIGICVGYIIFIVLASGRSWFTLFKPFSLKVPQIGPFKLILAVVLCVMIIPLWYLYFLDRLQSDVLIGKYFTEAIDESNKLLAGSRDDHKTSSGDRGIIVLFGLNPWLKVTTFGKFEVLEIQLSALESTAGGRDRKINNELNQIFLKPHSSATACIIKKYDVDYVYVSDLLPGRFYGPEQIRYYEQLEAFQSLNPSPFLELTNESIGMNQEYIRIFSVNRNNVDAACESLNNSALQSTARPQTDMTN